MTESLTQLEPRRGGLADGSKARLRQAVRVLGHRTASLRDLPDYLIVGAQRCGTTSLQQMLAHHPSVCPPLFHKGLHYFDLHYERGITWYRGQFPLRRLASARTRGRPVTGEASPFYMFHPLAPTRIAEDLPGVRLIALIRDPVERAFSAYKQERWRGFETESFARALELEDSRLTGERERMQEDGTYVSFALQHHAYRARGRYAEQLTVLFDLFGDDRVLVLDHAEFFSRPTHGFGRVQEFLELPLWSGTPFEHRNARPSSPIPPREAQILREHFLPHDERLKDLLGWTPSWLM
ncbi:MAG: sulfotransferase [Nocardioidaceae bacterium]